MKLWLAAAGLVLAVAAPLAQADSLRFCDAPAEPSAAEQDALLRFGAIIKAELDQSGQDLALVARSGLKLERFGQRYSHEGVALKTSANGPWSVRQLYYACDEKRPRIYDQGMSGFVLGTSDVTDAYISIVLLPGEPGRALEQAALDDRRSLALLGASYSANSYPFSLEYQNCNQWVAELLAASWGLSGGRADAQGWLKNQGYEPTLVDVGVLRLAGAFVPWVHSDDHPERDRYAGRYRVSLPVAIEGFVRRQVPGASRIEICRSQARVVIHHGWDAIAEGCVAGAGDEVIALN